MNEVQELRNAVTQASQNAGTELGDVTITLALMEITRALERIYGRLAHIETRLEELA